MYDRPLDTLLVTFGVGLILQQVARDIFGAPAVNVVAPAWLSGGVEILGAVVPKTRIFILVLAVVCVAVLAAALKASPMGRRIRAVVQNRDLAETSGISSRRTDITTFFIGSGLAGVAGVALTLIGSTSPTTGQSYLIDAFLVVVVGGLGQIKGTVIAAFALGLPELVHRVQHHRIAGQGDRVRHHRGLPAGPPAGPVHRADKESRMSRSADLGRWQTWAGFAIAAVAAVRRRAGGAARDFRLSLLGKYLCFAIVAVGIGLAWGRGGMLVLGQGVFFGLGGYMMAMHLKIADAGSAATGVPDFMQIAGVPALPAYWEPFASPAFTLLAIVVVPDGRRRAARPRRVQAPGQGRVLRDPVAGAGRGVGDPARRADQHSAAATGSTAFGRSSGSR